MGGNRSIYILFIIPVVVLIWLGNIYIGQNREQLKYTAQIEHAYQVIITLNHCENLVLDAETKQRGYLLTKDQHFRDASQVSVTKVDSVLNSLRQITSDNPKQRVNIHLLALAIQQRLMALEQNYSQPSEAGSLVKRLAEGKLLTEKIHVYVQVMEDEEKGLLVERNIAKDYYQSLNFTFVKYAFLFAVLFCSLAILMLIRELRKRISAQKMLEKSLLDLKRSNEEIEQITFTASHDLQEPLRKIRTLGTLFVKKYDHTLDPGGKDILLRIDRATEKMQGLINELVNFTTLLDSTGKQEMVDLNMVFADAFEKIMKDETVTLARYDLLPSIRGHKPQLVILFAQLLHNAYTYKDQQRPLVINLTYQLTTITGKGKFWNKKPARKYHQVTVSDNGIGFDNSFKEKIFVLFQRLHGPEEYSGKGTGLALVKRIMTNHYGHIEANGEKGAGATFSLYFPVE